MNSHQGNVNIIVNIPTCRVVAVRAEGTKRTGKRTLQGQTQSAAFLCLGTPEVRLLAAILPLEVARQIIRIAIHQVIPHAAALPQGETLLQSRAYLYTCRTGGTAAGATPQGTRKRRHTLVSPRGQRFLHIIRIALVPALSEAGKPLRHSPFASKAGHSFLCRERRRHRLIPGGLPGCAVCRAAGITAGQRHQHAETEPRGHRPQAQVCSE